MTPGRAVLLVGSAKVAGSSTSAALGQYLLDGLAARRIAVATFTVNRAMHGTDRRLLEAIAGTDLLILSTPLYVDSFPALVTRAMESIAKTRRSEPAPRPCGLAVIVNCGFPEAAQCDTAIAIARIFARRARFDWLGALALGGGGSIDGRPLDKVGGFARHVRAALDEAAGALAEGQAIPDAAIAQMARPLMPARLYTLAGNIGWMGRAVRNRVSLRRLFEGV